MEDILIKKIQNILVILFKDKKLVKEKCFQKMVFFIKVNLEKEKNKDMEFKN